MTTRSPIVIALCAVALLALACNRTPATKTASAPPPSAPPAAPAPVTQSPYPVTTDLSPTKAEERAVASVNTVSLQHPSTDALIIDVSGLVPSAGWTNPRLVPVDDEKERSDTKTYRFVATPPDSPKGNLALAINARVEVDNIPPNLKFVRIVTAENQTAVNVAHVQ